jgi:protein-S-isoprenylcysteine O-methyltransferase Ste14
MSMIGSADGERGSYPEVAGTMLVLGIGLVSGIVWFLLLAILAAFTVQKLAIEREERHLQARFGETYLDYARRVRRWI